MEGRGEKRGLELKPIELEAESKLIIALDMPDPARAKQFWEELALTNAIAKVGLELMFGGGVELIRQLAARGVKVFADAKLFDIPNTVERATGQIAALGASFLTVHAQDRETVAAAGRGRAGSRLKLLGVTVLTSTAPNGLAEQGIPLTLPDLVLRRAAFAMEAGFEGVVSSPQEAGKLKAAFGQKLAIVCPGIRPANQAASGDDQARTTTPAEALRSGADYIVVGRPIIRAKDPGAAARSIISEMAEALQSMR